jgi:hypothetical protein
MSRLIELDRAADREITVRKGEQSFTVSDRIPVNAAPLLLKVAESFQEPGSFDDESWEDLRRLMLRIFQARYPIVTQEELDDFLGIEGYAELASLFFGQKAPGSQRPSPI